MDSTKGLKPAGQSSSLCSGSDSSTGLTDYFQARITAFPTYTQITVEDPWIELFNAAGGIIALIDTGFLVLIRIYRNFYRKGPEPQAEQPYAANAGVTQVMANPAGSVTTVTVTPVNE